MSFKKILKKTAIWLVSSIATVGVLFIAINVIGGSSVKESALFFLRMLRRPQVVGAVAPTSSAAAEALAAKISLTGRNRRLLEAGAGTGSVTQELVRRLQPGDVLDVVELDKELAEVLQEKFGAHPQVNVHQVSITDWKPAYQYDATVVSIPFNAMPAPLVEEIWLHCRTLSKSGAPVSYISYIGFPELRGFFSRGKERKDFERRQAFLKKQFEQFGTGHTEVMANLPPADVFYLAF